MKKTSILFTVLILLLSGYYATVKTSKTATKTDRRYVDTLLSENIKKGMTPAEINKIFKVYEVQLGFWECADEIQKDEKCTGERLLVVLIPLPSKHILLGEGDAQIYFSISKENLLEYYHYELYYPFWH